MTDTSTTFDPYDFDALLAFHKAHFGDARMEDEGEGGQEPPEGAEGGDGNEDTDPPNEGGEGGSQGGDEGNDTDLPDWARTELTKVRGEAANYRVKLRDAEAKLSAAKTPEEFEAAVGELRDSNTALERKVLVSKVARKNALPDDLAELLQGSTEAELETHAKKLRKYAGPKVPPDTLGGGLDPHDSDDGEMDPRKLARRNRR